MSVEVAREVLGVGDRGEVSLFTFQDNKIVGGAVTHVLRYQVRMGAFTMHETSSKAAAERTARALVR